MRALSEIQRVNATAAPVNPLYLIAESREVAKEHRCAVCVRRHSRPVFSVSGTLVFDDDGIEPKKVEFTCEEHTASQIPGNFWCEKCGRVKEGLNNHPHSPVQRFTGPCAACLGK